MTGEPETTALPSSRSSTAGLALTAVVLLAACTSPGTTRATRSPSASAPPAATASVPPSPSAPLASPSGALAPIAPTFEGPVPAGFAPLSATFVSALDGFVLGEAPCGAATCTELAGTTDAGWSWERVNPPGVALSQLTAVRFATTATGYVYGPHTLEVTTDGGRTWAAAPYPGQSAGAVLDKLETAAGQVVALTTSGGTVLASRSPIGIPTWSPIPGASAAAPASGGPDLAVNGDLGFLISGPEVAGGPVGESWTAHPASCPPGLDAVERIALDNAGTVYRACAGPGAGGQYAKDVAFAIDTGGHLTGFSPATGGLSTAAPTGGQLEFLDAGGPVTLVATWAATTISMLSQSAWSIVFGPVGEGQPVSDYGFTNQAQGFAVLGDPDGPTGTSDGLYLTRDGGATWTLADFSMDTLPARCHPAQLTLSLGAGEAALGNTAQALVLRTGDARCSLDGYPGVTVQGPGGTILAVAVRSAMSYIVQALPAIPVVLGPGMLASFFLSSTDTPADGATSCPTVSRIVVYPPGATAALAIGATIVMGRLPPSVSAVFNGAPNPGL